MDNLDAQLLDAMQTSVPLVAQPWRQMAEEFQLTEEKVLHRVRSLRDAGVIRRIGGVFEASLLGYRRTLLALLVPSEALDQAASVVIRHPGVSHCYSRSGEFNLWATLAVSPGSALGVETTVQTLAHRCGATAYLNLPVKRRFKLAVRFGGVRSAEFEVRSAKAISEKIISLSDEQRRAVRSLQMDLPAEPRPFEVPAHKEGFTSGDDLLVHAADFLGAGILRRYAAVVNHLAVGAKANVLVVWRVPGENASSAGEAAARHQAVSHCYLRETAPGWPFNLYTMIHGPSREDCLRIMDTLADEIGRLDRRELWTIREYKKAPIQFFLAAEAEWEAR